MKILVPIYGMPDASMALVSIGHKQLVKLQRYEKIARSIETDSFVWDTHRAVIADEDSLRGFYNHGRMSTEAEIDEFDAWCNSLSRVPSSDFFKLPFGNIQIEHFQDIQCWVVELKLTISLYHASVSWSFLHPEDDSTGETPELTLPSLFEALPKKPSKG